MTTTRLIIGRGSATALLGAALFSLSAAAFGAGAYNGAPPGPRAQQMEQRRQDMVEARLNRIANRLEIKASQQTAWQAYVSSVQEIAASAPPRRPPRHADAATLLRFKAERLSRAAHDMKRLADATAELERVLTPDQQAVLNEIARREHERRRPERPRR